MEILSPLLAKVIDKTFNVDQLNIDVKYRRNFDWFSFWFAVVLVEAEEFSSFWIIDQFTSLLSSNRPISDSKFYSICLSHIRHLIHFDDIHHLSLQNIKIFSIEWERHRESLYCIKTDWNICSVRMTNIDHWEKP